MFCNVSKRHQFDKDSDTCRTLSRIESEFDLQSFKLYFFERDRRWDEEKKEEEGRWSERSQPLFFPSGLDVTLPSIWSLRVFYKLIARTNTVLIIV